MPAAAKQLGQPVRGRLPCRVFVAGVRIAGAGAVCPDRPKD
jgi:hypothetical protein